VGTLAAMAARRAGASREDAPLGGPACAFVNLPAPFAVPVSAATLPDGGP